MYGEDTTTFVRHGHHFNFQIKSFYDFIDLLQILSTILSTTSIENSKWKRCSTNENIVVQRHFQLYPLRHDHNLKNRTYIVATTTLLIT